MVAPLPDPGFPRNRSARRGAALLLAVAGGLALLAFRPARVVDVTYEVFVGSGTASVRVHFPSWPRAGSLSFAGDESLLGIRRWRFTDGAGRTLGDDQVIEPVPGAKTLIVRHGPAEATRSLTVEFEIEPAQRTDFEGRLASRLGACGPGYAALQGVHFLLMPHGFECGNLRVQVKGPPGWIPVPPASPDRIWTGTPPFDLVAESWILGPFREERPGRLYVHAGFDEPGRREMGEAYDAASAALGGAPPVPVVLAPRLPDETPVELMPGARHVFLDTNRVYPRLRAEIARALFESSVHSRILREPAEAWFSAGAGEWLADRALGGAQVPGVVRTHAETFGSRPKWDLRIDAMPPEVVDPRFWSRIRRTKAAAILGLLAEAAGETAVDSIVDDWRGGRPWSSAVAARLGASAARRCEAWLGGGGLPLARPPALHLKPGPASAEGAEFTLAYTGDGEGFIETCGCNLAAAGGLARRARAIASARARLPALLSIELGNFLTPRGPRRLDPIAWEEQKLIVELIGAMGTEAAVIADAELLRGGDDFRTLAGSALPGLLGTRGPGVPSFRVFERAGLRVAVAGHSPSRLTEDEHRVFGEALADVAEARGLEAALSECRRAADVVVLAGRFTPAQQKELLDRYGDRIDVLLNADPQARDGARGDRRSAPGGFEGRTLVLYHVGGKQGVSFSRIRATSGRALSFTYEAIKLEDSFGEDPEIRRRIDSFYAELGGKVGHAEPPMFAGDPWARRAYVDDGRCVSCHASEHLQWAGTRHARAFDTLVRVQRQNHAACVKCHVVGFGSETGYRMERPDPRLRNVGCQTCHGAGADHAAAPAKSNIRRTPEKATCMECHDEKHAPDFGSTFSRRWDAVRHK